MMPITVWPITFLEFSGIDECDIKETDVTNGRSMLPVNVWCASTGWGQKISVQPKLDEESPSCKKTSLVLVVANIIDYDIDPVQHYTSPAFKTKQAEKYIDLSSCPTA